MKTEVLNSIKIERIPGTNYVRLLDDFLFYSVIINCREGTNKWSCIPKGFVYDEESIPALRGTNPEAGAIHDYYSRNDSGPVVDKKTAAAVYEEFQIYYDRMEKGWLNRLWDWIKRRLKTDVVKIAPGYFHKHSINASYEEMAGLI